MPNTQTENQSRKSLAYAVDNLNEIIEGSVNHKFNRWLTLLIIKLAHIVAGWGIIQK